MMLTMLALAAAPATDGDHVDLAAQAKTMAAVIDGMHVLIFMALLNCSKLVVNFTLAPFFPARCKPCTKGHVHGIDHMRHKYY